MTYVDLWSASILVIVKTNYSCRISEVATLDLATALLRALGQQNLACGGWFGFDLLIETDVFDRDLLVFVGTRFLALSLWIRVDLHPFLCLFLEYVLLELLIGSKDVLTFIHFPHIKFFFFLPPPSDFLLLLAPISDPCFLLLGGTTRERISFFWVLVSLGWWAVREVDCDIFFI